MEATGQSLAMDYTALAAKLAKANVKNIVASQHVLRSQMSKEDYWKTKVHNEEDAVKYYEIYYPEYPDFLCRAFAKKMTEVATQITENPDNEDTAKYLASNAVISDKWDFKKELMQNGIKI